MYQFQVIAAILLCVAALVTADPIGILAATTRGLVAISLYTFNANFISASEARAVAFDTKTRKAIGSEESSRRIRRAYPNGTELEILKTGTGPVRGVAIDALTGNVYYSDYSSDRIMLCNSDVENCVAVATSPLVDNPNGIAVHAQRRQLYWTNVGTPNSIVKANLDGTNATQIVVGLNAPGAIVVDNDDGKIYWTEELGNVIGTSDLEGGNRRTLVEFSASPGPVGLMMHGNLLYIGNWLASNVQSVNKYTGANLTTIYSAVGRVSQLAIIDSTVRHYASDTNPCEGTGCSHLCVPSIDFYRCLCPEHMYLGGNQATCFTSK